MEKRMKKKKRKILKKGKIYRGSCQICCQYVIGVVFVGGVIFTCLDAILYKISTG